MGITLLDLQEIVLITIAMFVTLSLVGVGAAIAINLWEIRRRRTPMQLAIGFLVGIALMPIALYLTAAIASVQAGLVVVIVGALAGLVALMVTKRGRIDAPTRAEGIWALAVILIAAGAIVLLGDILWRDRLYINVVIGDHFKHALITDALRREGIAPENPVFAGEPARYYYFAGLTAAVYSGLTPHATGRPAFSALTVVMIAGILTLIPVYLVMTRPHIGRARALLAGGLLAITGVDVIPFAVLFGLALFGDGGRLTHLESWNVSSQVSAWTTTAFWVPQHLAALIACIVALLVLRAARGRWGYRAIGGAALASAVGLSIWVTLVFAVGWLLLLVRAFFRGEGRWVRDEILTGIIGVLLSLPFLIELLVRSADDPFPLRFQLLTEQFAPLTALPPTESPMEWLLRLPLLLATFPVWYALEFGFWGVIAIVGLRSLRRSRADDPLVQWQRFEAWLIVSVLLLVSVVRSRLLFNDFAWRGLLIPQFLLVIWAVDHLPAILNGGKPLRRLVLTLLIIGAVGTTVDVLVNRVNWWRRDFVVEFADVRTTADALRAVTPSDAIIQSNPTFNLFVHQVIALSLDRRMALLDEEHAIVFGASREAFAARLADLGVLWDRQIIATPSIAARLCADYGISVLIAKRRDPVWIDTLSWVWAAPAIVETPTTRAITCTDLQAIAAASDAG